MRTAMNDFYTYAYLSANGVPYYFGKGRGKRAYTKHANVCVPDYEKILILKKDLSEEEALKHEEYMIAVFNSQSKPADGLSNKLKRGVRAHIFYEKENADEWADPVLCSIFGSKTAACVLLFVNKNKEAHAMKISKIFNFGLNQTQRQLKKFEEKGVLVSRKIGSVRLYSFNQRLPTVKNLRNFLDNIQIKTDLS